MVILFIALAGCESGSVGCTEIGCSGQLVLHVIAEGAPVAAFAGSVTVGTTTWAIDCGGSGGDAATSCGDGDGAVRITLLNDEGGGTVTYDLVATATPDTSGSGYGGTGSLSPTWTRSQPNGDGCPPVCWSAEASLTLEGLDTGSG